MVRGVKTTSKQVRVGNGSENNNLQTSEDTGIDLFWVSPCVEGRSIRTG